jgi:hypothetical protein
VIVSCRIVRWHDDFSVMVGEVGTLVKRRRVSIEHISVDSDRSK